MQQIEQLSQEEKIRLILLRYKSTKDLWTYMTERLGYLMPSLKNCRLKHIQDILYRRKKVLHQKDVPAKVVPSWPELSVKQCYGMIVENCPQALEYLPDPHGKEQKLPEREFFWQVVYSLFPQQVESYILQIEQQRRQQPNLQDKKQEIDIPDEFLNELLKHDFTSTKKGRGFSSLLVQRKPKRQRKPNQVIKSPSRVGNQIVFSPNPQEVLHPPAGVMDVKKWHDQLNSKQKAAYQRGLQGLSGNKSEADGMNRPSQLANQLRMSLQENNNELNETGDFSKYMDARNE